MCFLFLLYPHLRICLLTLEREERGREGERQTDGQTETLNVREKQVGCLLYIPQAELEL